MKKLAVLLLALLPCFAFAQMHLPGAVNLSVKNTPPPKAQDSLRANKLSTLNANGTDVTSKTGANTSGTAIAPNRFDAWVLSTNFTVPLVRVNLLNNKAAGTSGLVSTSFLNSAGAGINYAHGEIDQTTDSQGNVASTDFINRLGFEVGFLFAANTASGSTATTTASSTTTSTQSSAVFAVMGAVTVLNFQIGGGYEFGTLASGQKRVFFTIAYAIPISALVNGGYKIFHASPISGNTP